MELQKDQIEFIRESFKTIKSKEDFLNLLNFSKKILFGGESYDIKIKQLNYYANPKLNRKRYLQFKIRKKSGGERTITSPSVGLKVIQKALNLILQTICDIHPAASGFVPGKSVLDNAKIHVGSIYMYNIDLKDFFPSIDQARVWGRLKYPPFNLNEKNGRLVIANIIASLCCHEMEVERLDAEGNWHISKRNVLPQGAPTSPVISNIICQKLDLTLNATANKYGVKYTRYADDITFSSMHNVYQNNSEFLKEVHEIIRVQNFNINKSKTRLQKQGYRQEVTGLVVNIKPNVHKRYVKNLRMWLHYWERYGYDKSKILFISHYRNDKGYIKKDPPDMANVIKGKLNYLKMIVGNENESYSKLLRRYNKLTGKDPNAELLKIKLKQKSKEISEKDKELIIKETTIKKLNWAKSLPESGIIIHDPKTTISLLNEFSKDTYLKYTTHIWDRDSEQNENVDREIFQEKVKEEIEGKGFNKLQEIGLKKLYWTIRNFIDFPTEIGWGKNRLKFAWYSQELIDYYKKFRDKQPGSFEVPEKYLPKEKISGKSLKYFEDFIEVFKNEIEFRGNIFHYAVKRIFESQLGFEYNLEIEGLKGINVYSDTYQIIDVLEIIASNIRQRPEKNKHIRIIGRHIQEQKFNEIRIEDVDSFSYSDLDSEKLNLKGIGQLKNIRDKLISLCDFSIESVFRKDNIYRGLELQYLSIDRKEIKYTDYAFLEIEKDNPIGFTYILKFYE